MATRLAHAAQVRSRRPAPCRESPPPPAPGVFHRAAWRLLQLALGLARSPSDRRCMNSGIIACRSAPAENGPSAGPDHQIPCSLPRPGRWPSSDPRHAGTDRMHLGLHGQHQHLVGHTRSQCQMRHESSSNTVRARCCSVGVGTVANERGAEQLTLHTPAASDAARRPCARRATGARRARARRRPWPPAVEAPRPAAAPCTAPCRHLCLP